MDANLVSYFVLALLVGLLALAAVTDVNEYRIPNRIVLAIAALYPVFVFASPLSIDWIGGLAVAGAFLAGGVVLFFLGRFGGGDVKLLTVTALWAGPALAIEFMLVTAVVGGLMAVLMSGKIRFGLAMALDSMGRKGLRDVILGEVLPYGVAIAVGGVFVVGRILGA